MLYVFFLPYSPTHIYTYIQYGILYITKVQFFFLHTHNTRHTHHPLFSSRRSHRVSMVQAPSFREPYATHSTFQLIYFYVHKVYLALALEYISLFLRTNFIPATSLEAAPIIISGLQRFLHSFELCCAPLTVSSTLRRNRYGVISTFKFNFPFIHWGRTYES